MKRASLVLLCLMAGLARVAAQVPQTVSYQGRLLLGTNLVNGTVGLSLRLFNTSSGGSLLYEDSNSVAVVDGLYSTYLGDQTTAGSLAGALTNASVWLETMVNGTALTPRERIASVPYSLNVSAAGIVGTIADGNLSTNIAQLNAASQTFSGTVGGNFSGSFSGNGGAVTNVSVANISGLPLGVALSTNAADPVFAAAGWTGLPGGAATSSWVMATASAAFGSRPNFPGVLAFSNKLWLLGGDTSPSYNDVWSSSDGASWFQVTPNAPWSARMEMAMGVFSNRMWMLGGSIFSNGAYSAEVWSSPDGTNWTMAAASASFGARYGHVALAFSNKLWVIGGRTATSAALKDVWSSPDGIAWTSVTTNAAWTARLHHQALVMSNAMWVFGGSDASEATFYHDVYRSTDGANWTQVTNAAAWTNRCKFGATVDTANHLYVLGGQVSTSSSYYTNDCWVSSDGAVWTRTNTVGVTAGAGIWSKRQPSAVYLNNRIWVYGGQDGYSDVWRTTLPAPPDAPGYSAVIGTQTFYFYAKP